MGVTGRVGSDSFFNTQLLLTFCLSFQRILSTTTHVIARLLLFKIKKLKIDI